MGKMTKTTTHWICLNVQSHPKVGPFPGKRKRFDEEGADKVSGGRSGDQWCRKPSMRKGFYLLFFSVISVVLCPQWDGWWSYVGDNPHITKQLFSCDRFSLPNLLLIFFNTFLHMRLTCSAFPAELWANWFLSHSQNFSGVWAGCQTKASGILKTIKKSTLHCMTTHFCLQY